MMKNVDMVYGLKERDFATAKAIRCVMLNSPICPYCNNPAKLVTGREIYPKRLDLYDKKFYACMPCGAYVGCHPGTERALGGLANKETREARGMAHQAFDPMWKSGKMSRREAYAWLKKALGAAGEVHIGNMSVKECSRVTSACYLYRDKNR